MNYIVGCINADDASLIAQTNTWFQLETHTLSFQQMVVCEWSDSHQDTLWERVQDDAYIDETYTPHKNNNTKCITTDDDMVLVVAHPDEDEPDNHDCEEIMTSLINMVYMSRILARAA